MTETVVRCDRCRASLGEDARVLVQITGNVPANADSRFDLCPACRGEMVGWMKRGPKQEGDKAEPAPVAAPAVTAATTEQGPEAAT